MKHFIPGRSAARSYARAYQRATYKIPFKPCLHPRFWAGAWCKLHCLLKDTGELPGRAQKAGRRYQIALARLNPRNKQNPVAAS